MSIFGKIAAAIFGSSAQAAPATAPGAAGAPAASGGAPAAAETAGGAAGAPKGAAMSAVDVAEVLDGLAEESSEDLDWRKSIVDLMKLIGVDSSLNARKELAQELKFDGDMKNSAAMNIWLHKQVMAKLAANGGKVPAELLKK